MKITFDNKSDTGVIITLTGTTAVNEVIPKGEVRTIEVFQHSNELILIPEGKSDITYLVAKFGLIFRRYFKTTSGCAFTPEDNMEILLLTNKSKGSFGDEYERIVPFSNQTGFTALNYSVSDELRMKKMLEQASNKGGKSLKLLDFFDILGNAFTGLLILLIPFILIWIFSDIYLAAKICGIAFIPIFIIIILINRFSDKVKKIVWKQAKGFALRNQIFKDYNSYFEDEYIKSVFKKNK